MAVAPAREVASPAAAGEPEPLAEPSSELEPEPAGAPGDPGLLVLAGFASPGACRRDRDPPW